MQRKTQDVLSSACLRRFVECSVFILHDDNDEVKGDSKGHMEEGSEWKTGVSRNIVLPKTVVTNAFVVSMQE